MLNHSTSSFLFVPKINPECFFSALADAYSEAIWEISHLCLIICGLLDQLELSSTLKTNSLFQFKLL